jgi:hypothetical protein
LIGIPRAEDLRFFGDRPQEAAWKAALAVLENAGAKLVPVDFTPLFETAALLYEGPWVAERHAAIADVLAIRPDIVHPVTRRIIESADGFSASALFKAQYRLKALKRETDAIWSKVTILAVPTTPVSPTLAELEADPITPNSRCGTYTNFVNLPDACRQARGWADLHRAFRTGRTTRRVGAGVPREKRGYTGRNRSLLAARFSFFGQRRGLDRDCRRGRSPLRHATQP